MQESEKSSERMKRLLDGVLDGDPTRYQCEPDEEAPVTDETADEAEETLQKRGLVDPFHAVELQERQNERRRENSNSLMDTMEDWDRE